MKFESIGDLADAMEARVAAIQPAIRAGLDVAGALVRDKARAMIGEYQPAVGELPEWEPLKPGTQAERVRLGFTADDPLLRTGALREAIEARPVENGVRVGVFGDNDLAPIAFAQELGTSTIPPRSFVRGAGFFMEEAAAEAIGLRVHAALDGDTIK